MTRLRHILVGYNFFPDGEVAVASAGVLATREDAMLYILHAIEPVPAYRYVRWPSPQPQAHPPELVTTLKAEITKLVDKLDIAPLSVITDVRAGKPFVELIAAARRWPADVIVVGTSQRGEGRLLGSTADRVLRKSPVPVLLAKQSLLKSPKTILVPTDFSSCAQQAAGEGVAVARAFGSRVVFVHVLEQNYVYPPAYGMAPILIDIMRNKLQWVGA